jgi:hypothetical protein
MNGLRSLSCACAVAALLALSRLLQNDGAQSAATPAARSLPRSRGARGGAAPEYHTTRPTRSTRSARTLAAR